MTTAYVDALTDATAGLADERDPDGVAARRLAVLAAHAGLSRADTDTAWDLFTAAMTDGIAQLQAELPDPVVLAEAPSPGADGAGLRLAVAAAANRLADLCTAAAAGDRGSPWRRLLWARVALRFDEAAEQLR